MPQPIMIPTPGDRVPDFVLPDCAGVQRMFYNELAGGPIVLFVCGPVRGGAQEAALAGIVARAEELRAAGAELFALSADDVGTNAATARRLAIDFPLFADPSNSVVPRLLVAGPPRPPASGADLTPFATFVLDPNQRILTVLRASESPDHAARALDDLRRRSACPEERHVLVRAAPVLTLPSVLDPAFCRTLIEAWETRGHHEGGVSSGQRNVYAPDKKKTLEHIISDPELNKRISLTLARRIGPELVKVFNYSAPFRFDGHIIISYREDRQDFFGIHRDNLRQTKRRRFAMSLNLNDDFEGGELSFPEYGPHPYRMKAGTACVFSCALLHEALPVTRGQRWVLTTFFCDVDGPDLAVPESRRRALQV